MKGGGTGAGGTGRMDLGSVRLNFWNKWCRDIGSRERRVTVSLSFWDLGRQEELQSLWDKVSEETYQFLFLCCIGNK